MLRCSKHFYSEEENSATIYHLSVCMKMDPDEATKVVIEKLAMLEPEHVVKRIMGYIYFQGITAEEMIRLAMGPDHLIHELIQCAKSARLLASPPMKPMNPTPLPNPTCQFTPFNPERMYPMVHPYFDHQPHQMHQPNPSPKMVPHYDYISLEDPVDSNVISSKDYYHTEAPLHHLKVGRSPPPSVMGFPVKTCHYFNRGYCKHGSNCRYLHVESSPEGFENIGGDMAGGDQVISPGSLQKLEFEIVHLLKSRRGNPVSIASLPMLYYEKYDRTLQAEGYLTESKRHGKAGYSLTKLLVRLKNSIRLIDRPHGQHAVVLAEDALKYMDIHSGRNEPGHVVPGSRQIYLTFPADSTFTEDDVSRYFNTFGPVQDVRIPCQMKRMFGFVTFASADTVKLILSKGNPHYVCNARVLVKPYREKAKLVERKYLEKFDRSVYCNPHPVNMESGLQPNWQSSRLFQRHQQQQLMQEHEQALELEAMHLAHLQLPCKPVPDHPCFSYSMPDLKVTQDQQPDFLSTKDFNFLVDDVLNSPGLDSLKLSVDNGSDDESSIGLNLPDSPFAAAVASSIAAIL